ncbi:MAG: hypothetical protein D6795_20100 [Deltaproteobacteria bacterium]|nr:MAG: hypothetical protein D6795_20100 [Deltaproteobacteria bacterium]
MKRNVALLAALLVCTVALPVSATRVIPLSLDKITNYAGQIFIGTVVDRQTHRDEQGTPATFYTFKVEKGILGVRSGEVQVKFFGFAEAQPDGSILSIPGMPKYEVGDKVYLFLHPASDSGFTSPVGVFQGSFPISKNAEGKEVIEGLSPHVAGLPGLSKLTDAERKVLQGPSVDLETFSRIVERLVRERQEATTEGKSAGPDVSHPRK